MEFVWAIVVASLVSFITTMLLRWRSASGTLKIDRTNPEKDVYRLCIDDLDNIATKKQIVLNIDPNADLSQE